MTKPGTPNPQIVRTDTTVAEAARTMAENDIGAAPICNSEAAPREC